MSLTLCSRISSYHLHFLPLLPLQVRVAGTVDSDADTNEDGNVIYYDICNNDGEIIRVTRNGWEIIKHGDPVFKHSRNQLPLQKPSKEYPSDILAQFLNLTNLPTENKENRIIAEVYISLFLPPDIAKPILLPYGEQGSAKSTFGSSKEHQISFIRKNMEYQKMLPMRKSGYPTGRPLGGPPLSSPAPCL